MIITNDEDVPAEALDQRIGDRLRLLTAGLKAKKHGDSPCLYIKNGAREGI